MSSEQDKEKNLHSNYLLRSRTQSVESRERENPFASKARVLRSPPPLGTFFHLENPPDPDLSTINESIKALDSSLANLTLQSESVTESSPQTQKSLSTVSLTSHTITSSSGAIPKTTPVEIPRGPTKTAVDQRTIDLQILDPPGASLQPFSENTIPKLINYTNPNKTPYRTTLINSPEDEPPLYPYGEVTQQFTSGNRLNFSNTDYLTERTSLTEAEQTRILSDLASLLKTTNIRGSDRSIFNTPSALLPNPTNTFRQKPSDHITDWSLSNNNSPHRRDSNMALTIAEICDLVKEYDGNPNELNGFIHKIDALWGFIEQIDPGNLAINQRRFLLFVEQNLVGRASIAIQNETYVDWPALRTLLRTRLVPQHSVERVESRLLTFRQQINESTENFGQRAENLLAELERSYEITNEQAVLQREIDRKVRRAFESGLTNRQLRERAMIHAAGDLRSSINYVIGQEAAMAVTAATTPRSVCGNCQGNHPTSECRRTRNMSNGNNFRNYSNNYSNNYNQMGNNNGNRNNAPQANNNNQRRALSCYICGSFDHLANACNNRPNTQRPQRQSFPTYPTNNSNNGPPQPNRNQSNQSYQNNNAPNRYNAPTAAPNNTPRRFSDNTYRRNDNVNTIDAYPFERQRLDPIVENETFTLAGILENEEQNSKN